MNAAGVPDGYRTVAPYLVVKEAEPLLEFMTAAFDADERMRMPAPDGGISHAEVTIGDSVVMVGSASEQWTPSRATIHLYVEDCDATYAAALKAGATSIREPTDESYGDRMAGVEDPSGTTWWMATRVENLSPDEMARRSEQ